MAKLLYLFLLVQLVSNAYASESEIASNGNDSEVNAITEPDGAYINGFTQFVVFKDGGRPDHFYRASQVAFVGSIVADLGSTWRLPKGMVEGNPVLGKRKVQQASLSAALSALALWEAHSLKTQGHARAAKCFLLAGAAAHAFSGLHNALH